MGVPVEESSSRELDMELPVEASLPSRDMKAFSCRPRLLYFSTFIWISITGGRFLAPFLEHEAGMSAELIGATLAVQSIILTSLGSIGGSMADNREKHFPGKGRADVMAIGIVIGTICTLLHAIHYLFNATTCRRCFIIWHLTLRMLYAASTALIFPVLDGITIDSLQGNKENYGKERLWGAISWAMTNLVFAPLLDKFGFVIVYPLTILGSTVVLFCIHYYVRCKLDGAPSEASTRMDDEAIQEEKQEMDMISLFRLLSGSVYGSAFLLCLFCLSQGQAVVESLIFLFFEFLGSSYTIMGVTVLLTVAFEIPIFHIAPSLLEKLELGPLLLLACCCYIIRVVGYSLIPEGHVYYVLLLEPLHGITYGLSQTAAVDAAARSMPPGYEATGQGLIYVVKGAGSILGLLFGGWADDHLGPRVMYRSSACIVLIGSTALIVVTYVFGHLPSWSNTLLPQEDVDDEDIAKNKSGLAAKSFAPNEAREIELT